jgi:peroxiredoxin
MTPNPLVRGTLLPAAGLLSERGEPVSLRGRRGPAVLFAVHAHDCAGCVAYVGALAAAADAIAEWGGGLLVVVPETTDGADDLHDAAAGRLRLLADHGRTLGAHLGPGAAAVLVADEWGEIHFAAETGLAHELPSPGELVEWVRFIAIQCPECEGPEGEWRNP